jgi:hypothetical protein
LNQLIADTKLSTELAEGRRDTIVQRVQVQIDKIEEAMPTFK